MIEVDAAGDDLAPVVSAIPVEGLIPPGIVAGQFQSQVEVTNQIAPLIIDADLNLGGSTDLVGDPRFRIEGVGIVLTQARVDRYQVGGDFSANILLKADSA